MKKKYIKTAFWLLAVLGAGAAAGENSKTRPYVAVSLNNNPKVSAAWRNQIDGKKVDLSNTPGITVNGGGFKDGSARIAVYFAGELVGEGVINIRSGAFEKLIPLSSPLADPREIKVRIGGNFSQSVPVRLKRLRGSVRLADGSPAPFPLVTTGLYRFSDFFVTAIGDKKGNFEVVLPETIDSIAIYADNSSKAQLACRKYGRLEVCMEPQVKFTPGK